MSSQSTGDGDAPGVTPLRPGSQPIHPPLPLREHLHRHPPVTGYPGAIAGNRWRLPNQRNRRDSQFHLAILGYGPTQFKSLVGGKVPFQGETVKQDLPQPESSGEIAHIPTTLYGVGER